jgi:hypothetical protein
LLIPTLDSRHAQVKFQDGDDAEEEDVGRLTVNPTDDA